jgi:hypothetical protein
VHDYERIGDDGCIYSGSYAWHPPAFWSSRFVIRRIPYLPIWHGVVINTLVFAMMWGIVLFLINFAVRGVVRTMRSWRGRCRTCAYSRAGLGASVACPECGTPGA